MVRSRRRELLGSKKAKALAAAGAFAILLAAVWGVTYTPLFAARQIVVEGAVGLTREEVLALAKVDEDTNVFHLDADETAERLEASPWVRDASVVADLPDALTITVVERVPVVVAADGVAVAGDGVALPGASVQGLPVLSGAAGGSEQARSAALLLASMAPSVRAVVGSMSVGDSGELELLLQTGTRVSLGAPGEEVEKAEALRALIAWADGGGITPEVFDVSVPGTPTAVLEGGGTVTP